MQEPEQCLEPLLAEASILDVDTTVKPLYGRQEGAVVGCNPKKPGRPSHCYHTYSMAGTRLVFDVDVCAGDQHASKHCAPGLWALLGRTPRDCWPTLLRGDKGFVGSKRRAAAPIRAPFRSRARSRQGLFQGRRAPGPSLPRPRRRNGYRPLANPYRPRQRVGPGSRRRDRRMAQTHSRSLGGGQMTGGRTASRPSVAA